VAGWPGVSTSSLDWVSSSLTSSSFSPTPTTAAASGAGAGAGPAASAQKFSLIFFFNSASSPARSIADFNVSNIRASWFFFAIFIIVNYTYSQYFILPILRINSSRFSTPPRGTRFLPKITPPPTPSAENPLNIPPSPSTPGVSSYVPSQ
jgi:hypothetical protein